MKYRITVDYGRHARPLPESPPGGVQIHDNLEEDRAQQGVEAFLRDLWQFHGSGVSRLTVEAVPEEGSRP